jgi:hypothetical protein
VWIVELIKPPRLFAFRADFFPRKFRYKKDAEALRQEVAAKGGEAVVKPTSTKNAGK